MVEESWLEDDRSQVFMNASILALRDGQLSNGEKRILVKLAHALRLQEDEPKRIYDAILSGETDMISAGTPIGYASRTTLANFLCDLCALFGWLSRNSSSTNTPLISTTDSLLAI